ncbi:GNAT family N-acetyltransferase [Chitinivorax sp. B]|uniref:GNAT family N-acetyltransferase n=1 Tax=Chitinivorax sp. B TaxID=2502235 RepID=UPI0010F46623|nr:GNAT family N-acetyltransferase [Chitinivorax sp. B]
MTQAADLVQILPYQQTADRVRRDIAMLMHRVWPDLPPPGEVVPDEHDPSLAALSCFIYRNDKLVSYAAVVHLLLTHTSQTFRMAALSCVATDPAFQQQGLGRLTVQAATRCIEYSHADLGLFTCDPPLAAFYEKAGWPSVQGIEVLGSLEAGALSSTTLGKAVLLRLLSPHARAHAAAFSNTTLSLGLPVGQFI